MKPNPTIPSPPRKLDKWGGRPAPHSTILKSLVYSVFVFLTLSVYVSGQTTTSTIEGTITDSNGAVVAGANVKVTGVTLAVEREATTDSQGFYRVAALPAGN